MIERIQNLSNFVYMRIFLDMSICTYARIREKGAIVAWLNKKIQKSGSRFSSLFILSRGPMVRIIWTKIAFSTDGQRKWPFTGGDFGISKKKTPLHARSHAPAVGSLERFLGHEVPVVLLDAAGACLKGGPRGGDSAHSRQHSRQQPAHNHFSGPKLSPTPPQRILFDDGTYKWLTGGSGEAGFWMWPWPFWTWTGPLTQRWFRGEVSAQHQAGNQRATFFEASERPLHPSSSISQRDL